VSLPLNPLFLIKPRIADFIPSDNQAHIPIKYFSEVYGGLAALLAPKGPQSIESYIARLDAAVSPGPFPRDTRRGGSCKSVSRLYPAVGHNRFDLAGSDPDSNHCNNRLRWARDHCIPGSRIFAFLESSYASSQ
jgi:hypothetical protein